ncbi:MAG: mechanosensitive ion channel, partial [Ectothiorhodospiraceae bacterium]
MEAERGPAEAEAAPEPGLAEQIASAARTTAQAVAAQFRDTVAAVTGLALPGAVNWGAVGAAALQLGLLIGGTLALSFALRWLGRLPYSRADRWVLDGKAGTQLLRRLAGAGITGAIDATGVAVAWLGGWGVALFVLGEPGSVNAPMSLFLTAFVAVEGGRVALRLVFAKRDDGLRLFPLEAADAAYWQGFLTRLVAFVGYGLLLVVPLVADLVGPGLGQAVYVLVVVLGFTYAVTVLWRSRRKARNRLEAAAQRAQAGAARLTLSLLAHLWHLVAIAYFTALAVALLIRPERALPLMVTATLQTLVAIGLGVVTSVLIGRAIRRGVPLPEFVREKLPQAEVRLNAFVPRGLQAMHIIIGVLVFAVVLDAWHAFDLRQWLATGAGWQVVATVVTLGVILVAAIAVWIGLASWIDSSLSPESGTAEPSAQRQTLLPLFRNTLGVVLIVITVMVLIAEIGISVGPMLAGLGVIGVALGFGAQTLVKDIIGGVFIQLENSINTGDWVTAGNISGTAETVGIRSVGLRDLAGTFHFVPFSAVDTVSNYNRDFAYHVEYYGVAYREDTDQVVSYLIAAFRDLMDDPAMASQVMGDVEIDGISEFADSSVRIRVRIMTQPGMQWTVGRAYNRLVKKHLDAAGIEIPFPHTTLYFGSDQEGHAPPAN